MKRLACALVLAGFTCALQSTPREARAAPARASSGLQLAIITPDPNSIGDRLSIDVSFRGSAVETVELYLDNALVAKRQLNMAMQRGVITFTLETARLAEGAHQVRVAAYGPDGRPGMASARLRIPAADLTAPVRISYPLNGTPVSGVVTMRVALDPEMQKQKPYVSFWVDKELKVLRNYPPYEYNWDTSKATNGWHVLEAWSQTDDSLTPIKSRVINVNVNNSAGDTKKQDTIPDLSAEAAPKTQMTLVPVKPEPVRATVDPSTARTGAASANPGVIGAQPTGISGGARPQAENNGLRMSEPGQQGVAATSAPATRPVSMGSGSFVAQGPQPRMMGGAATEPARRMAVASVEKGLLPNLQTPAEVLPVIQPVRSASLPADQAVKPGELIARPGRATVSQTTARVSAPQAVKPQPTAVHPRIQIALATPHEAAPAAVKPTRSLIAPRSGAFDVAYNGTLIAFDVQPRIQGGIGLAPFRQIFEHTGGRLYWYGGQAQSVRAVNDTREIELKIGDAKALINNKPVTLETAPFIEKGRTIVPMSFVRDALNVNVHYDAASGRVLIESK